MTDEGYRSGFIAIIGRSNVGKSTLMNALIGQKVAIMSSCAQTTRNRIQGVLSRADYQMVFVDTPGVHKPHTRLGEYMVKAAKGALEGVDAILVVVDVAEGVGEGDRYVLEHLPKSTLPIIIAANKMDIAPKEALLKGLVQLAAWREDAHAIIPISAKQGEGLDELIGILSAILPSGPQYFPDDMITDQPERNIAAEIIREKALMFLQEEVPHGIAVDIQRIQSRTDKELMDIHATIYCERDSHKGMIIGKKGNVLKKIGSLARVELEGLFGLPVNLQLWVKVKKDWRNDNAVMHELGYH